MSLTEWLATRTDRCQNGFTAEQHPAFCACKTGAASEWAIFRTAVRSAARDDGTVHLCDVRPLIRGRIEPKHIGQMWRRARSEGLVRDTGEREQSDDVAGRNADKLDRIYRLGRAA